MVGENFDRGFSTGCGAGCGFLLAIVGGPILVMILITGWAIESGSSSPDAMQDVYPTRREAVSTSEDEPPRLPPGFLETQAGVRGWFVEAGENTVTLRLPSGELLTVPNEWLSEESRRRRGGG